MTASQKYPEANFITKVVHLNKYRVNELETELVETWDYYPSRNIPEALSTVYEKREGRIKPVTFTFRSSLTEFIEALNIAALNFP